MRSGTSGLLLDKEKVEQKYKDRQKSNLRVKVATFRVPRDMGPGLVQAEIKRRADFFIEQMDKRHWLLASDVKVAKPRPAFDLETNVPLLDQVEFRIKAVFKYIGPAPDQQVVSFPTDGIKQSQDHDWNPLNLGDMKQANKVHFG